MNPDLELFGLVGSEYGTNLFGFRAGSILQVLIRSIKKVSIRRVSIFHHEYFAALDAVPFDFEPKQHKI